MGTNGVSEDGAGTGERVGETVNGISLASGSIAVPGACGDIRPVWAETSVYNELAEVGGFGKEFLDRGIRGEDVENLPKDLFETVKARIISGDERLSKFKPHSQHEPPTLSSAHPIEWYITHILANILDPKFPTTLPQQPYLSKSEKSALRFLCTNPNILILPAEKGNTTDSLHRDNYLAKADRQLSDRSTYQPLASNPTHSYNQDLHRLISPRPIQNRHLFTA